MAGKEMHVLRPAVNKKPTKCEGGGVMGKERDAGDTAYRRSSVTPLIISKPSTVGDILFTAGLKRSMFVLGILLATILGCTTTPATTTPHTKIKDAKDTPMMSEKDPFLWLEEIQSEKAMSWVRSQNEATFAFLEADPGFQEIEDEALEILEAKDRIPHGSVRNGLLYNFWRDDKNTRGLWRRVPLDRYLAGDEDWEILLDVDQLAKDEDKNWVYKGVDCLAPEFTRCFVKLSIGGKDAAQKREFNLDTKDFVKEGFLVPDSKSHVVWVDVDTVIVGSSALDPAAVTTSGYARSLHVWHRGQPLSEAKEIFSVEESDLSAWASISWSQGRKNILFSKVIDFYSATHTLLSEDLSKQLLLPIPSSVEVQGLFADRLLFTLREPWPQASGETIPKGALIAIPLQAFRDALEGEEVAPIPHVEVIVAPDERAAILRVSIARDELILSVLDEVKPSIIRARVDAKGAWSFEPVTLPGGGLGVASVQSVSSFREDFFVTYESFLQPETLYYSPAPRKKIVHIKALPERFDASNLKVEQRFAESSDGERIPYFIVSAKDIVLNGENATYLSAYGGFEISNLPSYRSALGRFWLEKGGVFVLANIRGGGEFGPRWHQAALKEKRQHAFDDFHAVAENLIETKVTSPKKLGIQGGSNGGLLMGVAFTQRPDLYNAVLCQVPLLDMMRYHKLLAGASWMAEYGDPDIPEERAYILKYSPYQNLSPEKKYPKVFFTTSTLDDRVHPGHARKMAAKMLSQGHDLLYFENIEGGHGGVANNKQLAFSLALRFTYLKTMLNL